MFSDDQGPHDFAEAGSRPDLPVAATELGFNEPYWLARRTEISSNAKRVYAFLRTKRGKHADTWWRQASANARHDRTIAAALGLSADQVHRAIAELVKAGLLRVERASKGGRRPNHYFFPQHEWIDDEKLR